VTTLGDWLENKDQESGHLWVDKVKLKGLTAKLQKNLTNQQHSQLQNVKMCDQEHEVIELKISII
jgi:hypothetical protein